MTWATIAVALIAASGPPIASPNTITEALVAVLEDLPPVPPQAIGSPRVRVAFHRTGDRWRAFPDGLVKNHPLMIDENRYRDNLDELRNELPKTVTWIACSAGQSLGAIRTVLPPAWPDMSSRGTHRVADGGEPPRVGERTTEFSGWTGIPAFRPLVLSTSGRCSDPDKWKPRALPPSLATALPEMIRESALAMRSCEKDGHAIPCDLAHRDWRVGEVLASRDGEWLVHATGADPREAPLRALFHVSRSGRVRALGLDMRVLDAGDWDADGQSEVLAKFERYNHDGYTLFSGKNLTLSATFGWIYH